MDTRTGQLGTLAKMMGQMPKDEFDTFVRPVNLGNLTESVRNRLIATGSARVGRNDPCPCGSGSKFKRCCLKS
jgi:uncharacterized protein YecA (UPF0149 family)